MRGVSSGETSAVRSHFPMVTEGRRRRALVFCDLLLLPAFLFAASLLSLLLSSLGGLGVTGLFRVYMWLYEELSLM